MKFWMTRGRLLRLWVPGGTVLALGGCGLSDQQLTSIMASVISTGLNSLVSTLLAGLTAGGGG